MTATPRFYRDSDMEQGTAVWRAWRRTVLGASDAPTIMQENPWKSASSLLDEKLGRLPEFLGNAATREGQALEPHARAAISEEHGIELQPALAQSSTHAFLAASLDAIDEHSQNLFEIKCGVKAYETVASTLTVPKYYYAQLQHQLMVTGLGGMYYVAYRPGKPTITVEVEWDGKYIDRMLDIELEFADVLTAKGHRLQDAFLGMPVH